jgi:hypothetical protein
MIGNYTTSSDAFLARAQAGFGPHLGMIEFWGEDGHNAEAAMHLCRI